MKGTRTINPQPPAFASHPGIAARRAAVFAIARWNKTGDFPDRLIASAPDHAFVMSLVYGVVKMRRALEWLVNRHMKKKAYGSLEAALLVGAHQLFHMPEIPPYAVLNATVEAAKLAAPKSAGLVNAVLRKLLNNRVALLDELRQQPLDLRASHPDALVNAWRERYGDANTETLCAWDNTPADTVLCLLPHADMPAEEYIQIAANAGVTLTPHPAAPATHLVVPHGAPSPETFPGYDCGLFIIQDPGCRAAIDLLDVRPGMSVLDACAAPGGKTLQIASRMIPPDAETPLEIKGRLIAMEKHEDRLPALHANLARSGIMGVDILHADASAPSPPDAPCYDRILLDAPCSNTGVLRRRPDARWRFTPQRLKLLRATQRALLKTCLSRLARGGRIVYSTCSLEPAENLRLVESVLSEMPYFRLLEHHQQLPFEHHTDGMFAAVVEG